METSPAVKTCKACGQSKPLDQFELKKARGVEYRRGTCHACMLAYFKQWYAKKRQAKRHPPPGPVPSTPSGQKPWSLMMGETYVPAEV